MVASLNGWIHAGQKFTWKKGEHIIKIRLTDSRKPRGFKTIWLIENKRIGGRSTRIGYASTWDEGLRIASQFMRKM